MELYCAFDVTVDKMADVFYNYNRLYLKLVVLFTSYEDLYAAITKCTPSFVGKDSEFHGENPSKNWTVLVTEIYRFPFASHSGS